MIEVTSLAVDSFGARKTRPQLCWLLAVGFF
jgi:hypothetical protein